MCATGCAQIFGIDEACEVGTGDCPLEEGTFPLATCTDYCNAITTNAVCSQVPQYTSADQCMAVCQALPTGGDPSGGHSLECRAAIAARPALESADCQDAGPAGGDTCGGPCASYCGLMEQLCPDLFDAFELDVEGLDPDRAACAAVCQELTGTPGKLFDAGPAGEDDPPGAPSAQCRIWHLIVAATYPEGSADRLEHCGHAVATRHCGAVPGDPRP